MVLILLIAFVIFWFFGFLIYIFTLVTNYNTIRWQTGTRLQAETSGTMAGRTSCSSTKHPRRYEEGGMSGRRVRGERKGGEGEEMSGDHNYHKFNLSLGSDGGIQ